MAPRGHAAAAAATAAAAADAAAAAAATDETWAVHFDAVPDAARHPSPCIMSVRLPVSVVEQLERADGITLQFPHDGYDDPTLVLDGRATLPLRRHHEERVTHTYRMHPATRALHFMGMMQHRLHLQRELTDAVSSNVRAMTEAAEAERRTPKVGRLDAATALVAPGRKGLAKSLKGAAVTGAITGIANRSTAGSPNTLLGGGVRGKKTAAGALSTARKATSLASRLAPVKLSAADHAVLTNNLLHILADRPASLLELREKLRHDEATLLGALAPIAAPVTPGLRLTQATSATRFHLKPEAYRQLQPWRFEAYDSPQRERALANATHAFLALGVKLSDPEALRVLEPPPPPVLPPVGLVVPPPAATRSAPRDPSASPTPPAAAAAAAVGVAAAAVAAATSAAKRRKVDASALHEPLPAPRTPKLDTPPSRTAVAAERLPTSKPDRRDRDRERDRDHDRDGPAAGGSGSSHHALAKHAAEMTASSSDSAGRGSLAASSQPSGGSGTSSVVADSKPLKVPRETSPLAPKVAHAAAPTAAVETWRRLKKQYRRLLAEYEEFVQVLKAIKQATAATDMALLSESADAARRIVEGPPTYSVNRVAEASILLHEREASITEEATKLVGLLEDVAAQDAVRRMMGGRDGGSSADHDVAYYHRMLKQFKVVHDDLQVRLSQTHQQIWDAWEQRLRRVEP
ncbi:hypothetical protein CXG81DRAFT_28309 [Caulochytrium protostelioides]|uniref:RNA polymerase II elongation factor ELL N-terminal domain-containing protein n=1 Tax=Caulochytrium protostelioides TaxID=1555241 RepID=A0A4P9X2L8_9FUNG|nr:hypothetical protein CXG81DRAFT_28309 [Caulochytrium protostelioides]|eukprot:RKO98900.1 hypothetical protein CXG81DRAFT_28309 [Caulochytrium protostelioides]